MKVMLVNGSPHKNGCTNRALEEIKGQLEKEGIDTEIFWIGTKGQGCTACFKCHDAGKCVFDDSVNEFLKKAETADGFIFGSPVYYGSIAGSLKGFMDRLFSCGSRYLQNKPAASVVSCRRGGATEAFAQMNMYYTMHNMPVVSSQYWNQVHGFMAEDVEKDAEGLQTMRTLGANMAWLLKCIEAGKKNGVLEPVREQRQVTNFIR